MKNTSGFCFISILTACTLYGCGFKSDLFIPGEPKTVQQLDSASMEDIKKRKLDELQDTEIFKTTLPEIPVNTETQGVPIEVEPLTEEELKKLRDKNKR